MSILNSILLYMIDTRGTKPRAGLAYYSKWLIQEGLNPEPGLAYYSILLIQEGLNTESA
jgi:hypothetical protein